jgi:hypothetical protein
LNPGLLQLRADVSRLSQDKKARKSCRTNAGFQRDNAVNNGDNLHKSWCESRRESCVGRKSSVMASRKSGLLIAVVVGGAALTPVRAHAQWWSTRAPVDFEECADLAEKAATREARTSELAGCNAKFAGRRKPSGGYTYYDFMQNRSFDIAGPNPTPEEQKYIDQQYTVFLDKQRRSYIAAALTAKQDEQNQQDQQQQASLRNEKASMPTPPETPVKPKASAADLKSRAKAKCAKQSTFSCEWPVLSEKITNLKKALFGSSQAKAKHGGLSSRGEASEPVQSAAR